MKKNKSAEAADLLCDAVAAVRDRKEAELFLNDLCTVSERFALQQRLEVAKMLRAKATYQAITDATGASTATISRVNRSLSYGEDGYHTILDRLEGNVHE